jgi:hypothetical protein
MNDRDGVIDGDDNREVPDLDADVREVLDAVLGSPGVARRARGADPDPALVARSWTHVREEDQGEIQAYRPSDADLPPSRGRTTLDLSPDGTLQRRSPGPDDRLVVRGGTWELRGRRLIVRPEGGLPMELEIELLKPDRLLVRLVSHGEQGEPHA